ncbi:MAG: hypothetical protein WA783_12885 [Phormidesmis sp.]
MSAAIRESFTLEQAQALENAIAPRTHRIDIRGLVPLRGKETYFMFLVGANRRSRPNASDSDRLSSSYPPAAAAALTQKCRLCPNTYRILVRMPENIGSTFTPAQIRAIEAALVPHRHRIKLCLSLPFFGKGAYLVFAAGRNRRKARYYSPKKRNPFTVPAVFGSVVLSAIAIAGLVQLRSSKLLAESDPVFQAGETFYPTAVPFKKNRRECEESNRKWIDGQCIDRIHDPIF